MLLNREDRSPYSLKTFLDDISDFAKGLDLDLISYAYKFAEIVHFFDKRKSNEPFFIHCYETSKILASLYMDTNTIAAGLLHDTLEDTEVSRDLLSESFGEEITFLVDGVTKISNIKIKGNEQQFIENYRKLFLATGEDPRVIIIKFSDRLHNMRTLDHLPAKKQIKKARETMDIYAPLAHRLGIGAIKWELEDLSFKYLYPSEYESLRKKIIEKRDERQKLINTIITPIKSNLEQHGIFAQVTGRPKHLWSIYRKMKTKRYSFDKIYDLLALRIITKTKEECYYALGIIHSLYKPLNERFKDYIANPKANLYQSIHTTIISPDNQIIEIQIRTEKMHNLAEKGIAAHWLYKDQKNVTSNQELKKFEWFRQLIEWHQASKDKDEFVEGLKNDVFQEEIFVFTPRNHPMNFTLGATVLDFAFAIHTDIGLHCSGAKINGKIVPLHTEMKNGDTIEILTSKNKTPSWDWLDSVSTIRAKSKIKNWFKKEGLKKKADLGKSLFEQLLKKNKKSYPDEQNLTEIFKHSGYSDIKAGFAAIGNGELGATSIYNKIHPPSREENKESRLKKILDFTRREPKGIRIQSIDSISYRFAKCCQPIPGDEIVGFISRGRGISVHRKNCGNIASLNSDNERLIDVYWDVSGEDFFQANLFIQLKSNAMILSDITHLIQDQNSSILKLNFDEKHDIMDIDIVIKIKSLTHLSKIVSKIKRLKGVIMVKRK